MQFKKNKIFGIQQPGRIVHRYAPDSQSYTAETEYILKYSTLNLLRSYDPVRKSYYPDVHLPFQPQSLAVSRGSSFAQCNHEAVIISENGHISEFSIHKADIYEPFISEDGKVLVVCTGDFEKVVVTSYLLDDGKFEISKQFVLDPEDCILGNASESSVLIFNQSHLFVFSSDPDVKSMYNLRDLFGGNIELNDVCADVDITHLYALTSENDIYKISLDTLSIVPEHISTLSDDCFTIRIIDGLIFALSGHKLFSISVEDYELVSAVSDDALRPFEIIDACHDVAYIHSDHDSYFIFNFDNQHLDTIDCIPKGYVDIISIGESYFVNFGDCIRKYDHSFQSYESLSVHSKCESIHSFGEDFIVCTDKSKLFVTLISSNQTYEIDLPETTYELSFCPTEKLLLIVHGSKCGVYDLDGNMLKTISKGDSFPKISNGVITTFTKNHLKLITCPSFDEVIFEFPDHILDHFDIGDYCYVITESNERVSFNIFNKLTMKVEFRANTNIDYLEDSDIIMSHFGENFAFGFRNGQEAAYYINGFLEQVDFEFALTSLVWKSDDKLVILSDNAGIECIYEEE